VDYSGAKILRPISLKKYSNCSDMGCVGSTRVWKHKLQQSANAEVANKEKGKRYFSKGETHDSGDQFKAAIIGSQTSANHINRIVIALRACFQL
jgi:hypothetical protein